MFTCEDACKLATYVPQTTTSSSPSTTCGGACSNLEYDIPDVSSMCTKYRGKKFTDVEPKDGTLTGDCVCAKGYRGLGCTVSRLPSDTYSGASSHVDIPLSLRIPVTVPGVQYQSVLQAYLRSLARETMERISQILSIDIDRIDVDLDADATSSYLHWMRGETIVLRLWLHAPVSMASEEEVAVGSTDEMDDLSTMIVYNLKKEKSRLRSDSPRILNHLEQQDCCKRVLMAAPHLVIAPSDSVVITVDPSKWTRSTGYDESVLTLSNNVANSNPAVIQSIQLSKPVAPWLTLALPSSLSSGALSLEYGATPVKMTLKIDRSVVRTMPAGSYFQVVSIEHHLLDASPHSIQVRLEIQGGGGSNSGSGSGSGSDIRPGAGGNGGGNSSLNPEDLLQEEGFIPGVVVGAVSLCLLSLILLIIFRCCQRCCGGGRRAQLQKANKKRGTPSTKFSKIQVDDDGLDGLELAVSSSSSSSSSSTKSSSNEFGILRPISTSSVGLQPQKKKPATSSLRLLAGVTLDAEEFEPTWQSMDLTKLWGSTLKTLPTEQEWEDLMVADSILCMASGQVDDTQKFYFYATDIERHLYLVEASITKSSKRLACVFKASSKKNATMSNLESFIVLFQNRIVGYLTRI